MPEECFFGIDTSCYTTSIAKVADGEVKYDDRIMLSVPQGSRGLRQSEAVFAHIKNIQQLFLDYKTTDIKAIGYSQKPCDMQMSYMPVFVVGESFAVSWAKMLGIPAVPLTHQHGHIYSAFLGRKIENGEYCAFHVSGGTLDVLEVKIEGSIKSIKKIGGTLDITCGQLIDRAGVKAGLPFPAGRHIEKLYTGEGLKFAVSVKGLQTNLSGAETQVLRALDDGEDSARVLSGVIDTAAETISQLIKNAKGYKRFIFTGGVMSNSLIRKKAEQTCFGLGAECIIAEKKYCSDNAAGVAYGAQILYSEGAVK